MHSVIVLLKTDALNVHEIFQVFFYFFFNFFIFFLGGSSSDSRESCISANLHFTPEGEGVVEIPNDLSESTSPCT